MLPALLTKAASSLASTCMTAGYSNERKAAREVGAVPPARDDRRAWGDGCQLLGLAGWDIQGDTAGKLKPRIVLCFSAFLRAGESFHS